MDEIIKRLSERLADQSSRRSFFSKMGKAVLGAAAVIAGQGFFAQVAEARPGCCTLGHATFGVCPSRSGPCPAGTYEHYTWHCGSTDDGDAGDYYVCHDCYDSITNHLYCVYITSHS